MIIKSKVFSIFLAFFVIAVVGCGGGGGDTSSAHIDEVNDGLTDDATDNLEGDTEMQKPLTLNVDKHGIAISILGESEFKPVSINISSLASVGDFEWSATSTKSWLSVTALGVFPELPRIKVDKSQLADGMHYAKILLNSEMVQSSITINVGVYINEGITADKDIDVSLNYMPYKIAADSIRPVLYLCEEDEGILHAINIYEESDVALDINGVYCSDIAIDSNGEWLYILDSWADSVHKYSISSGLLNQDFLISNLYMGDSIKSIAYSVLDGKEVLLAGNLQIFDADTGVKLGESRESRAGTKTTVMPLAFGDHVVTIDDAIWPPESIIWYLDYSDTDLVGRVWETHDFAHDYGLRNISDVESLKGDSIFWLSEYTSSTDGKIYKFSSDRGSLELLASQAVDYPVQTIAISYSGKVAAFSNMRNATGEVMLFTEDMLFTDNAISDQSSIAVDYEFFKGLGTVSSDQQYFITIARKRANSDDDGIKVHLMNVNAYFE